MLAVIRSEDGIYLALLISEFLVLYRRVQMIPLVLLSERFRFCLSSVKYEILVNYS